MTRTSEILGYFLVNPDLAENPNLTPDLFPPGFERESFKAAKKLKEKSGTIDFADLAREKGIAQWQDRATRIAALTDGTHKISESAFHQKVVTALKSAAALRLVNAVKDAGSLIVEKVDPVFDDLEDAVRKYIEDVDSITDEKEAISPQTVEALAERPIQPIEYLASYIAERRGFTLIGGVKGLGKSLFVTQLALHLASAKSPFLHENILIEKPVRVLYIQQEVSQSGIQDRLKKMRMEQTFDTGGRFYELTTTGKWINITRPEGYRQIRKWCEDLEIDELLLDPLYSFTHRSLNQDQDIAYILNPIQELKNELNLGVGVVHHFSAKISAEEMAYTFGRFMGHTNLVNAADNLITLDFLHPRYKTQSLPLPYQHYVSVQTQSRHGHWLEPFMIERKKDGLLFHPSTIWAHLKKLVPPGKVEEILHEHGGQLSRPKLIEILKSRMNISFATIKRALKEAEESGTITQSPDPDDKRSNIVYLIEGELP